MTHKKRPECINGGSRGERKDGEDKLRHMKRPKENKTLEEDKSLHFTKGMILPP